MATLLAFMGMACHQPKVSVGDERGAMGESAPASSGPRSSDAGAPSGSPPATGTRCSADADCRTWSSYCNDSPCTCQVVGKTDPDPHCSSPGQVACFADPCMKKAAACQSGRCELVMADTK